MTRLLSLSRYFTVVAVFGILIASLALLAYEGLVVLTALIEAAASGAISPKLAKVLAVGLIEAVDIFLIAIVAHMIGHQAQREFSQRFGISRASLREALLTLETLGLLKTEAGRGTFVAAAGERSDANAMAPWRYSDS